MPVEDGAVGLLLELLAEEDGVQDDALGVHAAYAQLLQELAPALAVERDELVVRGLPVERWARAELTCESARFTSSCVNMSKDAPLTGTLRSSSWLRSTWGFCCELYGSQKNT